MADELAEYCSFFPEDDLCKELNAPEEPVIVDSVPEEPKPDVVDVVDVDPNSNMEPAPVEDSSEVDGDGHEDHAAHDSHDHGSVEDNMIHYDEDAAIWQGIKLEKLMEWSKANPMLGNVTYLAVASGMFVQTALRMFRYHRSETYEAYKSGNTNWISLASDIGGYSALAIFGVAAVLQGLSMGGIAADLNIKFWHYGVEVAGGAIMAFVSGLLMWAYEEAFKNSSSDDAAVVEKAEAAMDYIESSTALHTAEEVAAVLALYMEHRNWSAAQWAVLSQEEKDAYVAVQLAKLKAMEEAKNEIRKEHEESMHEEPVAEEMAGEAAIAP